MNRLTSSIKELWWEPYSWLRGKNAGQTKQQTITHLLWFYLFSVILAFLSAVIQIWGIPAKWGFSGAAKDILGPLSGVIGAMFSFGFIRDVIATELDAAAKDIEREVEKRFSEEMQKAHEQADGSDIKYNLDLKYLAYVKPIIGANKLKLQGVSPRLIEKRGKDSRAFVDELDKEFEERKTIREVRCIIHSLTDEFLQQLAVAGIAEALHLKKRDASKRTNPGNDLCSLRVDVYAYLSAWLICSIDNDMGTLMSIQLIDMRYTREGHNAPDKEIYKNVIQAIKKIIVDGRYKEFGLYPRTDPLSSESSRITIINYLDKLIDLLEKHSVEPAKSY
jgi:hypothetical protein